MFLEWRKKQYHNEKTCVNYSLLHARRALNRNEYEYSKAHLENAIRSLNELIRQEEYKEELNRIKNLIKEIDSNGLERLINHE